VREYSCAERNTLTIELNCAQEWTVDETELQCMVGMDKKKLDPYLISSRNKINFNFLRIKYKYFLAIVVGKTY
jgi:hypothetical protein